MVNHGYKVISPNYRVSTGYGKEFQQANLFDMGGGDLHDVLAAADWIKQTGYLDPKKLVIVGGCSCRKSSVEGQWQTPEPPAPPPSVRSLLRASPQKPQPISR